MTIVMTTLGLIFSIIKDATKWLIIAFIVVKAFEYLVYLILIILLS